MNVSIINSVFYETQATSKFVSETKVKAHHCAVQFVRNCQMQHSVEYTNHAVERPIVISDCHKQSHITIGSDGTLTRAPV